MRSWILAIFAACLFAMSATTFSAQALTNADVIAMVKAGLPESTLLLSIKNNPSKFSTAPADLIDLQKKGVPPKVLDAMMEAQSRVASASAPAPVPAQNPAMAGFDMSGGMSVFWIGGSGRSQMVRATPSGTSSNATAMLLPFAPIKLRDVFSNPRADLRMNGTQAAFEVIVPPGVRATDQVVLVRFTVNRKGRMIETARIGSSGFSSTMSSSFQEKDRIPVTAEPVVGSKPTNFGTPTKITPNEALPPGEYAVVVQSLYHDFGVD